MSEHEPNQQGPEELDLYYASLGEKEVKLTGDVYEARFTGRGFSTRDYEDTFLSDLNDDQSWGDFKHLRKILSMRGLFPKVWHDTEKRSEQQPEIEYEITVKAKLIKPE